jgi:hypothetical protein
MRSSRGHNRQNNSQAGKGREGKGREGKGTEVKGREGKGREGKGTEEKGREGKGREGKGREGCSGSSAAQEKPLNCSHKKYKKNLNDQTTVTVAVPVRCTTTTAPSENSQAATNSTKQHRSS